MVAELDVWQAGLACKCDITRKWREAGARFPPKALVVIHVLLRQHQREVKYGILEGRGREQGRGRSHGVVKL